ncbi:MAG: hypothetical protein WCQ32_03135 [bacterium]
MEQNTKKNIGIAVGIVAVAGVALATFAGDKKPDTTVASNTSTNNTSTPVVQNTDQQAGLEPVKDGDSDNNESDSPAVTTVNSNVPQQPVAPTKPATVKSSTYKNGSYSATGSYMSPGGEDQIAVTLTIANDIVTAASVTPEAGDHTSARYQEKFISGYQGYVVGKNIASIYLTKVSGASLTPKGFNDALNQIKAQAKA